MNKKVFISMLVLTISFLVGLYVLKIFFPAEFMMSIQNEQLIKIGTFISSHEWLRWTCAGVTSFIIFSLYCGACCRRLVLKFKEYILIAITSTLIILLNLYDANLSSAISFSSFIFLPALMNGDIKIAALVSTFHGVSQCLSLSIRSLPLYLVSSNYLTILFMTLECYFWLLLFYIVFNYKKEKKND